MAAVKAANAICIRKGDNKIAQQSGGWAGVVMTGEGGNCAT